MKLARFGVYFIGLLLGSAWSMTAPGCIIPDYCIELYTPGLDWCRIADGAMMWPNGQPDQASAIINKDGGPPVGCLCFNDADQLLLTDKTPAAQYQYLIGQIEQAARDECNSLVPLGYDHNCYFVEGPDAPLILPPFSSEPNSDCVGRCKYINPPPHGDCPDKNPYECNESGYGAEDEVGASETSEDESDATEDTGDIASPSAFITCVDRTCSIDADYARMLWDDPGLLADDAILIFDAGASRFVFMAVEPGTLAYELGLRSGDVLESVDGTVIDDLDAAMQAYLQHEHATSLQVLVLRSARALDFTYLLD